MSLPPKLDITLQIFRRSVVKKEKYLPPPTNYGHSCGTTPPPTVVEPNYRLDRESDAPSLGRTGSLLDPRFKQDELFSMNGPMLFTQSRCLSEVSPGRPILQPGKVEKVEAEMELAPLDHSAGGLSTRPSGGEKMSRKAELIQSKVKADSFPFERRCVPVHKL